MNILYTAIFGNYDILSPVTVPAGWKAVCFTDGAIRAEGWEVRQMEGYAKAYRHIKTCPHLFLEDHELSVWVDGNIVPATSRIKDVKADYTLMSHPHRACCYAEAKRCIELGKDKPETIDAQMARYRAEGYAENMGMVATGVIIRRPGNEAFGEDWWKEIRDGSVRDQLSFNYVAHKHGLEYDTFPFLEGFKKILHRGK